MAPPGNQDREESFTAAMAQPEPITVEAVYGKMQVLQTQISALSDRDVSSGIEFQLESTSSTDNDSLDSPTENEDTTKNSSTTTTNEKELESNERVLKSQASTGVSSIRTSITYGAQPELPPLPIPSLNETLNKFLQNLEALQTTEERAEAKQIVLEFMKGDGPTLQELLLEYDRSKRATGEIGSYVEEFWNDSYLAPDASVVLNLNPFFVLEGSPDPKLSKDPIRRAAMLCFASIKLASQLRFENLKPDTHRGKPLCMDQFKALFSASRVPMKDSNDAVRIFQNSSHVAVMCCSQIYYFNALWPNGDVALDEGDLLDILSSIRDHAKETDPAEASRSAVGLLTSLGRNEWAVARDEICKNPKNKDALHMVDSALFVLVLDDYMPRNKHDKAANMLHGSYKLQRAEDGTDYQAGSCCNRWYDKIQIIVCGDATAGINFEHSAIDGHTALRFVSDIYAETVIKFARSITKIVHSYDMIPHVVQAKVKRALADLDDNGQPKLDIMPKKITLELPQSVLRSIFFAETALGDQIVSSDTHVLEFKEYGKKFITHNKLSPDSYVQMSMMLAYYRLYGRIVCTYEPVLTKSFYHGRTEAMRSATLEAKHLCEVFNDPNSSVEAKLSALRNAARVHSQLVKECARGKGVDRHLFALKCIAEKNGIAIPPFFRSAPWKKLNHTVLSTSNCGNPSLALFGFGPVVSDGFGIGYIIKDSSIYYSISSKHRQTQRYASTLESVLKDMASLMKPVLNKRKSAKRAIVRSLSHDSYGDIWGESTPPPSPKSTKSKSAFLLQVDERPNLLAPALPNGVVPGTEEIPVSFAFNHLNLSTRALNDP